MKQLGKFSIYQQPETSSAAVYFHKRRQFDGMLGYGILIRRLPIEVMDPENEVSLHVGRHGVYRRPKYQKHHGGETSEPSDPRAGVNNQNNKKTYQGNLYDGYPEILVVVSWDVAEHWTKLIIDKSDLYTTIVSYVITLFNGVDMLYSKLKETKIQINIAGIIIGIERESFTFLNECVHTSINNRVPIIMKRMDASCANKKIMSYLKARQNKISRDSYDVVVLLTRHKLFRMKNNEVFNDKSENFLEIDGLAEYKSNLYAHKLMNSDIILPSTIVDKGYFHNYPTIAHELGHLMSLRHDKPPFFTDNGECCGHILRTFGDFCDDCLSWSETSEMTLNLFYSSPNCCSFINKPRSLLPVGPHRMLTADEQCQCYGQKEALKAQELKKDFCYSHLICQGEDSKYYKGIVPMDGTPHGNDNEVCWRKISRKIETI